MTMQYRSLGRTGIKVSPYCLGAMMFGAGGNPDHDDCIGIVHKALDFGINFIDTADRYSAGESEEIVGKALKGRRDKVVLATKVYGPMGDDPNQQGTSRRWIIQEADNSLRRLQTDYIDLYQIHRPAPDTDIEETLSALTDLMRAGKVRAIGSSTFPVSEIVEAQWVAERRGLARFRTETAALFDPRPRHRARRASHLRTLWHGGDGVESALEGHAHRPLSQGTANARQHTREILPQADVR
jgi:aryl-alcohol dehydrogenase-like predicted oxidoreductase